MHIVACKYPNGRRAVFSLHPSQLTELMNLLLSCYKEDVRFYNSYIPLVRNTE